MHDRLQEEIEVLNRYLLTGTLAAVCSATLLVAQAPEQQPRAQQNPPATAAAAAQASGPATVIGCVYRERDVPGRAPNVAERLGVLEDYILMEIPGATPIASAQGRDAGETRGTSGAIATTGSATVGRTGRMYKLELIADDTLQTLVGRRVQVTGQIDVEEGDARNTAGEKSSTADKILGIDEVDLAEFEVSSISEVAGSCPTLEAGARQ